MARSWGEAFAEFFMFLYKVTYYWWEAIFKCILPSKWFKKDVAGQRVLITGAGSGLGKLMAQRFMELGCNLVLWDVNTESVRSMEEEMGRHVQCKAYTVDLADRDQIYQAADRVKQELGTVDILVNNAGIVTGRKFLDCPDNLIEKTMAVNANAHFWTVKAFLPAMMAQNKGHIVNIASSAGLFGVTGLADYCASKFAAVGFDESLRFELETMGRTGLNTTVVCPYFINTGMFDGVQTRFPWLLPILDPVQTVDSIMDAVLCNQAIIILPRFLYVAYALKGVLPVKVQRVLNAHMGISASMDTFVGRSKAE
ncbi:protein dhs-3-like [Babylonia areolata]|uniref:protein dhs-3-like n=1 Tax=Babylonia areolata TaxID=304850 RepID=UPI003FD67C99